MRINNIIVAGNVLRERFQNPTSVKSFVLFGAIIAFFVILAMVLSTARSKRGERKPQNINKFFEDDQLETKKLERTLSVALIAVAVVAVSITGYYLWEPNRQAKMTQSFNERSVRRGQALYANEGMEGYSPVQSLGCANCHGGYNEDTGRYAEGGTAPFTIKSLKDPATDEACADDEKFRNPDCITTTVSWEAPSLNVAMYRYPIRKHDADNQFLSSCRLEEQSTTPDCRSQVYDILVYGRPGTPMPAWGVAGGGPKNDQALNDLVNFIATIQLPADQAAQPLRSAEIIKQKKNIDTAKTAVNDAKEDALSKGAPKEALNKIQTVITANEALAEENLKLKAIEAKDETAYVREVALAKAQENYDTAKYQAQEKGDGSILTATETYLKALEEYDVAKNTYDTNPVLKNTPNPEEYVSKLEKDQTIAKLEKVVELAKEAGDETKAKAGDKKLVQANNLKNTALNFIESRDALARAKAIKEVFAPASLENSKLRLQQVQSQTDGQLLFESNCARCHTKGWTFFNPADSRVALPSAPGTGSFGPNLAGGAVQNQFLTPLTHITFIGNGSSYQVGYGERGIGSGRMPGFNTSPGALLDEDQISAIVDYERNNLTELNGNILGVNPIGSPISSNPNAGSKSTNTTKPGK